MTLVVKKGRDINKAIAKHCAKPSHPESKLQIACVTWFNMQWRQYQGLLFAIPNGGKRGKVEAGIMKGEGVVPGVADLMLAVPSTRSIAAVNLRPQYEFVHGLFIEMKYGPGKQSPAQIAFEQAVTAQGYQYSVCRTLEEFMNVINTYLK
jgi:hypothetical protein